MGVIYRAHDPEIDRPVAIKLIRADLLDGGDRADYLERFRREAQAAGRCNHPNIVAIYDFAMHEGNPFLAMEFVDGISLSQAYERGAHFTVTAAASVVLQVLSALGAAHAMGVVHRDIKPANILLVDGTFVKVTDFGISRLGGAGLTQAGVQIGTPSYMSPEQCRGQAVDARSDLFSAGIVLYEMLSGQRPFPGQNFEAVWHRLLNEPPPDIAGLNSAVTPALKAVIDRALLKPPEARFASAEAMAAALRAAVSLDGGTPSDHTVIRPGHGARPVRAPSSDPAPTLAPVFDSAVVSTIERKLTQYVGPIAHYLVQSAIRRADSIEALCESLARSIDQPNDRDVFTTELRQQLGRVPAPRLAGTQAGTRTGTMVSHQLDISAAERARVQTELTRYIGPVASVFVKRELAEAISVSDLWERLARRIEQAEERRAFLARRG